MKISIWQQFSSNHSSNFKIVGKFESIETAERVAADLRKIIVTIGKWWEQQGDIEQRYRRVQQMRDAKKLTPPEAEFQKELGVVWEDGPLDWALAAEAEEVVEIYRNFIFLGPYGDTWNSAEPFETLMQRRGGEVATEAEYLENLLTINAHFKTLDSDHADEMAEALDTAWTQFAEAGYEPGTYRQENSEFFIEGFRLHWFDSGEMLEKFRRLIEWIEGQDCTILNLSFEAIDILDEWEYE